MSSRYTEAVRGRIVTLETPAITIDLSAPPPSTFSHGSAPTSLRDQMRADRTVLYCVYTLKKLSLLTSITILRLLFSPFRPSPLRVSPPPPSTPWLEIDVWKNSCSSRSFFRDATSHDSCLLLYNREEKNDWDRTSW